MRKESIMGTHKARRVAIIALVSGFILVPIVWTLISIFVFRIESISIASSESPHFEICFNRGVNIDTVVVDGEYSMRPIESNLDSEKCVFVEVNNGESIDSDVAEVTGYVSAVSTNRRRINRQRIAVRLVSLNDTSNISAEDMDTLNRFAQMDNSRGVGRIIETRNRLLAQGLSMQSITAIENAFGWYSKTSSIEIDHISYSGDEIIWNVDNIRVPMLINSDRNQTVIASIDRNVPREVLLYREDNIIGCDRSSNSNIGFAGFFYVFSHRLSGGIRIPMAMQDRLSVAINNKNSTLPTEKQVICVVANIADNVLMNRAFEVKFVAVNATSSVHAITFLIGYNSIVESMTLDGLPI